jgi:alpha-L-fucosidase 2
MKNLILVTLLFLITITAKLQAQKSCLTDYNIKWTTPGMNSQGSMPLGNGDIGANVWVEENGDLVFLIGKSDSFDEFNRLLKLGRIRIKTTPALIQPGQSFSQVLHLADGVIEIKTSIANLRVWVDANRPVIQVDGESTVPMTVQVLLENWRKEPRVLGREGPGAYGHIPAWGNWPDKNRVNADTILPHGKTQLAWCHHNVESQWKRNLELTALGDEVNKSIDPVLNRSFGAIVRGKDFVATSDTKLETKTSIRTFSLSVYPLTQMADSPQDWKKGAEALADGIKTSTAKRFAAHKRWWQGFWNRSWIEITATQTSDTAAAKVSRAYALQRFVTACAGRGNLPIKFNGSLFTVEGNDPDFRAWGGGYWFQNTREAYWPMLYGGDYDMMLPLFNMYMKALPLRKAATKKYYGHEGAFFPETIYFWGNYMDNENYGIDRKGKPDGLTDNTYIRRYWQNGIELVVMMLDYYDATQDSDFRDKTLLPFAMEIMKFFDQHWARGNDGKILFDPAQSLETWHKAINPLPEIVGLRYIGNRLLKLPAAEASKAEWQKTLNDLPSVPITTENGLTRLLPAEKYSNKSNSENPELYAVFPYRVYTTTADVKMLKTGLNTWAKRLHPEDNGWQQNCIQAAMLGLTNEAKSMVVNRASNTAKGYRFPGFFGPNYDWTPEQCHGTNMMTALQRMLIQCEGDRIVLMPAWPKEWDVNFKLNAPYNTTVECVYKNGKVEKLVVTPESRKKDVVL